MVRRCTPAPIWPSPPTTRRSLTIEGLLKGEKLHPIQEAFMEHDGMQCGFLDLSGQIMSVKALLDKNSRPTQDENQGRPCGQCLPLFCLPQDP